MSANYGRQVALVPVQQERFGIGYKAMQLNGYRTGRCVCHGDSEVPVIWQSEESASTWLADTGFVKVSLVEGFHDRWSIYQERSAQIGDAMIRWIEDSTACYVIDIQAGVHIRGRQLLQWLSTSREREINAVGVVDEASGFWDAMEVEGLVSSQTDQDFMSYFGRSGALRERF